MRSRSFITVLATLLGALAGGLEAAPYVVRGQVVNAEGALRGAEIRLTHHPPQYFSWPADDSVPQTLEPIQIKSDQDGRFEIALDLDKIGPGQAEWLLEISAPGLARRILKIPTYGNDARGATIEELGGVLLAPGAIVRGRAVTAGTAGDIPLVGVRVSLWTYGGGTPRPWTATTGDDGAFSILDVPPGEYTAILDHRGFAPHRLERQRVAESTDLGTIVLVATRPLHGRVVDASGEPLAGVRVRFRHDLPSAARDWLPVQETQTGPRGEFHLGEIPPESGPAYRFHFEKQGYSWRQRDLEIAPQGEELRMAAPVMLERELVLKGLVTDPSGEPIAGARVTPLRKRNTHGSVIIHETDDNGRFRIGNVGAATRRLYVEARGFATTEVEVEASPETHANVPPPETGTDPISISLEPIPTTDLTVTVLDAQGRPVHRAEVIFDSTSERAPYHERLLTDDAGTSQLDQVPIGGPCSLEVRHPEHPRWWRSDVTVETGQDRLKVDFAPAPWKLVTVHGRVISSTGDPAPGVGLRLQPPIGSPEIRARTDSAGGFELRRVKEGAYRLIAATPGWAPSMLPITVGPDLPALEVVLGEGAILRGTIGGLDTASPDQPVRVTANGMSETLEGAIDGDTYRIDHLGIGRWSVTVEAGGARVDAEIEIEPGQSEANLDFELPPGHRVRGQLLIDGRPPAKVGIALKTTPEAPVSGYYNVYPDAEGRFDFARIPAGSYHLSHHTDAGVVKRHVIIDDETDLLIDVRTALLRGRVVDEATTGVGGVPIQAMPEIIFSHGPRWETVSGPDGWFEIGRVLPGAWTLIAKTPGFLERRLQLAVGTQVEPPILELIASDGLRVRVETSSALPHSVDLDLRDLTSGERIARGYATLAGTPEGHWSEAPPGRYRLLASNKLSWIETQVEIPGPVVTLHFPPAGALRLRIPELELESQVPWRPSVPVQVEANLELPDDPIFDGPRRRRSKRLLLKSLTPGLWRLEVRTADGRSWSGNAVVVDGRSSEVILGTD